MLSNVKGEKFVCYRPQMKFRKGNVLHLSVILFTGRCIPLVDTPLGRHLPKPMPPGRHPPSTWQTPLFSPGRQPRLPLADTPLLPWQTQTHPPPPPDDHCSGLHHLTLVVATSAILRV